MSRTTQVCGSANASEHSGGLGAGFWRLDIFRLADDHVALGEVGDDLEFSAQGGHETPQRAESGFQDACSVAEDVLGDFRRQHTRLWDFQIATMDREIDRLVYELYGLTEEEIRIVEGAMQV
jgi:hypothetical protein